MTIAILAMQGAFLEHGQMLDRLGVEHFEIRKKEDLDRSFDGLILPGGESTVMRKLLIELNIYDILKKKIEDGLPVFGTCAGLILLAEQVEDGVPCFGTMNILAKRNAYGRQLGSFYIISFLICLLVSRKSCFVHSVIYFSENDIIQGFVLLFKNTVLSY